MKDMIRKPYDTEIGGRRACRKFLLLSAFVLLTGCASANTTAGPSAAQNQPEPDCPRLAGAFHYAMGPIRAIPDAQRASVEGCLSGDVRGCIMAPVGAPLVAVGTVLMMPLTIPIGLLSDGHRQIGCRAMKHPTAW